MRGLDEAEVLGVKFGLDETVLLSRRWRRSPAFRGGSGFASSESGGGSDLKGSEDKINQRR
jgi:hypothetical protein